MLAIGTNSARWPPTLELEWFELPDARPTDCETRDGSEAVCAAVSIEFKQLKKHIRKLLNRKEREEHIIQSPWSKDGELRYKSVVSGFAAVQLAFDESRKTFAILTMPSCLNLSELEAFEPNQVASEPELVDKVRPPFPTEARRRRVGGFAVIHGVVRIDGRLTDLCSVVAVPSGYGFEESALEALDQWRWKPGTNNGASVDCLIAIAIQWEVH